MSKKIGKSFIPMDCYDVWFDKVLNGEIHTLQSIEDGDYHYDNTFSSNGWSMAEAIAELKDYKKQINSRIKELEERKRNDNLNTAYSKNKIHHDDRRIIKSSRNRS